MWFGVISIFPQMISDLAQYGVLGRAIKSGLISVAAWNPRDYSSDANQRVDDRPYGGGPGMIMQIEPLARAIEAAKLEKPKAKVICLSPTGKVFNQQLAAHCAQDESVQELIFIAGRYEGVDARIDKYVDEYWSLGDFVLSGGELAAMSMIDVVARLVPGVLGHEQSAEQDSFSDGLLEYPQYTRPAEYQGMKVPQVLLSGDHRAIAAWRLDEAKSKTKRSRQDLWQLYERKEHNQ